MIKKELLSFKHQIPVSEIDADAFKKAIHNKKVLCSVNGVKVNNPGTARVNIDVSFQVMQDFTMNNPGMSPTGKQLNFMTAEQNETNVKGKNITLNFKVAPKHNYSFEVFNTHEFYSIISNIFKSLDMMDNEENGSIIAFPKLIEEVLPGNRIYLSSVKVIDFSNYEVYGTGIGETQN